MKYKYLPHTADTKFRAYGANLEETFTNAALALTNVMVESLEVKNKQTKKIKAAGDDLQALLYDFLEQFLILLDSKNFFLSNVKKIKITKKNKGYRLEAEISGDDAAKYETIGPQVKAVTCTKRLAWKKQSAQRKLLT